LASSASQRLEAKSLERKSLNPAPTGEALNATCKCAMCDHLRFAGNGTIALNANPAKQITQQFGGDIGIVPSGDIVQGCHTCRGTLLVMLKRCGGVRTAVSNISLM
jgi:hypothetical protein